MTWSWRVGAGRLLGALVRVWVRTYRMSIHYSDGAATHPFAHPFDREIFALSERDALAVVGVVADRGFTVLVANGRDGDWAASGLAALGCHVVRGATARGGTRALLALTRALKSNPGPAGVIVDGPVGPVGQARPGVIACARHTGRPIRTLGVAASPAFVIHGAWSKLYLPLPFARVVIACDDPLPLSADDTRAGVDRDGLALSLRLEAMRRRALEMLALRNERVVPLTRAVR